MPSKHIPYFRFYPADFMGGVRGLSAQEVGVYTMLLCRMYEENGPIEYHVLRLATYCGMREKTFQAVAEKLIALGKIELDGGMIFNDRAAREISNRSNDLENAITAGKASAEKRQQKQSRKATPVQRPFNHTDTDTDTNTNNRDTNVSLALSAPEPASPLAEAVAIYNQTAEEVGWPRAQKITPARSQALKARLRDCGGIEGWRIAMDKGKASDFLSGRATGSTPATFDWITKQANFTKMMEGNYDNRSGDLHARGANGRGTGGRGSDMVAAFAAVAERAMARDAKRGEGGGGSF
jgi:uncharacterized protein YdaU (DUF1376 family)